jgi:ribose transport system permease protein
MAEDGALQQTPPPSRAYVWWHQARLVVPAYVGVIALFAVGILVNPAFGSLSHIGTVLVLASFLVVIGFGQGLTILTGGIDLSVPYTLTLSAVAASILGPTYHWPLIAVIATALGISVVVGIVNGLGIVLLGLQPLVMTLAMNAFLTGLVLLITNGVPAGSSPTALGTLMSGRVAGSWLPTVVLPLVVFVAAAAFLLARSTYGRRVYAVGNSTRVSRLSGVNVPLIIVSVYAVSGLCAGLAGLLLLGFANQSFIGMGDSYLLPSIAVVVIGGTSASGGRGSYIGTVGGVLLLELLDTVSGSLFRSTAVQDIVFGGVILAAMILARTLSSSGPSAAHQVEDDPAVSSSGPSAAHQVEDDPAAHARDPA